MSNERIALSRRGFLATVAGIVAGGGPGAAKLAHAEGLRALPLGAQPAGLPARQHAWVASLAKDAHGNAIAPRYDRLLFFDLLGAPDRDAVRTLEASLRSLERA